MKKVFTAALFFMLTLIGIEAKKYSIDEVDSKKGRKEEADKVVTLTIDEAVDYAKSNNITIKTQELKLKELKMKKNTSWNSVSPSLEVKGGYTEDFENETNRLSIQGAINLKLSGNLYSQIRSAILNYENGLITYDEATRQIEMNVREEFCALLYRKEYLALAENSLNTALNQWETNKNKYNKGQISELDVYTSRVNYEKKKPEVEQAKVDYINALALFKQTIGLTQDKEVELEGSLDNVLLISNIDFNSLPKKDSPAPKLQQAEYNLKIAKASLMDRRFSAYSPVISAGYTYGATKNKDIEDPSITNQITLSVSIPLDGYLPFSSGGVNIKSAKYSVEDAKLKLEDTKTSIAVETDNYIRKINQAITQLAVLKENVTLMETTYNLTKTAYDYGKTDLLNLQSSNDLVLDAKVSLKKQAYSLISSILELEYLLGIPYGSLEYDADSMEKVSK